MEGTWTSRRSPVLSVKGVCASSQPLASASGIKILELGGNAADAAVAMAAVLNLTEPCSTGIGGDAFALYFDAKTKKVSCLQGNGAAPSGLTLEYLNSLGFGVGEGLKPWDCRSGLCVTIPGAAALWEDVIKQHGRLPLEDALKPAIDLAEGGFPIAPLTAVHWVEGFLQGNEAERVYKPNGQSVQAGQLFKNPDLATTFRLLGTHGAKKGFYSGPVAEAIVEAVKEFGGNMTLEDLTNHATASEEPISTVYRGVRIFQTPPPSQGLAVLIALNIIQELDKMQSETTKGHALSKEMSFGSFKPDWKRRGSADEHHVAIEAMRRGYADALQYIGDPRHAEVPLNDLLSSPYAQSRAKEINKNSVSNVKSVDFSGFVNGETVYFCVVDSEGNACSMINSNYMGFGSGIVPKGTGFTLQNRGFNFTLTPGHNNVVGPNKRPYHTIIPSLATWESDGSLLGTLGNMGGFMQPMGHVQLIRNLIDFRLNAQEACDVPRWFIVGTGKTQSSSDMWENEIFVEDGFCSSSDIGLDHAESCKTIDELKKKGHKIGNPVIGNARVMYGKAQVILKDPVNGILWAGSGKSLSFFFVLFRLIVVDRSSF
jgi:gamma-glutamyltranspeptidase/glutathione hydrolase